MNSNTKKTITAAAFALVIYLFWKYSDKAKESSQQAPAKIGRGAAHEKEILKLQKTTATATRGRG